MSAHAQTGLLVISALLAGVTAGCGGDEPKAASKTPSPSTASPSAPTYAEAQLKSALLPPQDIGKKLRDQRTMPQGLSEQSVPTCPDSPVKVAEPQWSSIRHLADTSSPYGTHYAQFAAVYGDAAAAQREFDKIRTAARECPAKGNVESKKLSNNRIRLGYGYTWSMREESIEGWRLVRSSFKKTAKAAGKSNTLSFAMDYGIRGNALIASLYWERLPPGDSGDPISKYATDILTKQLQKIG
ncbi:hypothetical protein [Actinomadura sp. NBRC 104425]|uniref:hypothetical protein n=1 Tax=Actinomadura sp. NBRC 104425 TaxID=3032204 RepID=UPI0025529CE8|nr:hypothetical protein [Actinomadura sp. NBRC 104425]